MCVTVFLCFLVKTRVVVADVAQESVCMCLCLCEKRWSKSAYGASVFFKSL